MKLTVTDIKKFKEVIKTVSKVAEKKNTMPVLSHARIYYEDKKTYIMATDLETAIVIDITDTVSVEIAGDLLIPVYPLSNFLKTQKTEFTIKKIDDNWLQINNLKLASLPVSEYPAWPKHDNIEEKGNIHDLTGKLKKVSYASGESDTRYTLNSVLFDFENSNIVGTDGHRLAKVSFELNAKDKCIIPINAVKILQSLKTDAVMSIGYSIQKKTKEKIKGTIGEVIKQLKAQSKEELEEPKKYPIHALFSYSEGMIKILTRVIEGNYPDYKAIISDSFAYSFTVNKEDFKDKIKTVLTISKDRGNAISIYWRYGEIILCASNPDLGEIEETLPCESGNPEIRFGINGKYLLECLDRLESERVTVSFNNSLSPIMITENGIVHIIMPIRIEEAKREEKEKEDEEVKRQEIIQTRIQRKLEKARKRPDIVLSPKVDLLPVPFNWFLVLLQNNRRLERKVA